MGIFRQFPYSNFHDMNMDEIIKIVRDMLTEWAEYHQKLDTLYNDIQSAFNDFQSEFSAFLNAKNAEFEAFMNGIDVDAEFRQALNSIIADGTFFNIVSPIVQNTAAQTTTQWLQEHITQPTNLALDTSLTVAGAAADAKAVGDVITDLAEYNAESEILKYSNKNTFTQNGVTFRYQDVSGWRLSGSATAAARYDIYNSSSHFIGNIKAGDILDVLINSGNNNISVLFFFYVNNAWTGPVSYKSNAQLVVPSNATGMILRLEAAADHVYEQSIFIHLSKIATNQMLGTAVPVIMSNTGNDMKSVIEACLDKYGIAYITKGTTLISGISMPNNSRITGAGAGAVLKTFTTQQNGIVVHSNCIVDNITIDGGYGTYPQTDGSHAGIYIQGTGRTAPYVYNTKIHDCIIKGFDRAGIYMLNTGDWFANGVSITNCECFWNRAGIWIDQDSEFNKITNCICRDNYIGVVCDGGNNSFDNCTFSGNQIGIFFHAGLTLHNNGHGTFNNCIINHSGNNTGYAIIMREVNNGMIFNACQIWYGKILMESCEAVMFTNMIMGGSSNPPDIDHYNVSLLMLQNIAFADAPNIHGSASNVKIDNCYLMTGEPVTL